MVDKKVATLIVKCCYDCPLFDDEFGACQHKKGDLREPDLGGFIPQWCPLRKEQLLIVLDKRVKNG